MREAGIRNCGVSGIAFGASNTASASRGAPYSGAPHIPPGHRRFGSWFLGLGILGIGGLVAWLVVCLLVGWSVGWLLVL